MEITVQWVRTSWTKRSRGGPAATRRNAAPLGFPLPEPSDLPDGFAHVVRMSEDTDFAPRPGHQPPHALPLDLRADGSRLRVHAHVVPRASLPPRSRRPPAVRLAPGQWVRWHLNYRYSSALGIRDWSYWLDTFNIAHGPVARDLFVAHPPTFTVDERGPTR
ncbi:hypothetical protein [Streptomyces sedi]|uniref:Uncharacterized protein n=1 Tax=Streptomyces sedi TaxID=555059 RepID=A0A5C4UWC1_9ACTN|nr:hypothetical protein [Streptomyces sedi]TNM27950.1 hypothetical protein FH715_19360 [Streptomyces sedi]